MNAAAERERFVFPLRTRRAALRMRLHDVRLRGHLRRRLEVAVRLELVFFFFRFLVFFFAFCRAARRFAFSRAARRVFRATM